MEQYYGTGRRKAAVARVFLRPGSGRITVNGKEFQDYFRGILVGVQALEPLKVTNTAGRYDALITVAGGGPSGQADAIKLGVARALLKVDPNFRPALKTGGYLTRDARIVESKKYGLKKARRAPQFSKR
jgi:small subunit ribosomal protein S9